MAKRKCKFTEHHRRNSWSKCDSITEFKVVFLFVMAVFVLAVII